ncbi:hypothetical protein POJ06DRAFT_198709 [Lipomyces tetrasporus]|uniref:Zn(2)-C6 fungal-type domain-containing protein n=1 Tax=Lipomyces tetrasporus TaxID=54092 RepID=A0AAD7VS17_9ASCO|nr:uncharacterized protein POJ06DRAFT_198709 [Lipomyces tetrasporus]KAJ8099521.1 hypothetical protein POJ06DRAFT_198709 [Lipomyces tetrasporus]
MRATVHPTQRRFACEICRKHKSRCLRLYPNDSKCARCTLLGVECTAGQQKKVGRPRRAAASADEATKDSENSHSTIDDSRAARVEEMVSSQPASKEPSWSNRFSPAPTLVPILITTRDDGFSAATTWPAIGVDSLNPLQKPGKGSLSWDAPNDLETCSTSTRNSVLGITAPTSHSLNTPLTGMTASSPADSIYYPQADSLMIPGPTQVAVDGIAASEAMAKLSKINLNLHVRVAAAEANRAILDFNGLIFKEGPLYIDNFTLAEFVLGASQEFLLILTRLLANRATRGLLCAQQPTRSTYPDLLPLSSSQSHQSSLYNSTVPSSSYPFAASELLLAPLTLTITSIFIQLISLYELTLEHLTARIERIATEPIAPIPGLTFGGLPLAGPCTQGMLFSEVVVHLLERIERCLGIGVVSEGGEAGLLSARQMDVLWSELDERVGIARGRGMMSPAHVRELFEKVGNIFKQLSLS